ncbi:efflux RND transporter periplasmic adaptor subunit [Pseudomonadota bacterium]|jgi:HlyD family secretion protein|nr:efflux RND transporter periplasmic adaptor subunit [Pseudomonadota bacterium]|tara:strand:- start:177 stop:1370 length:1194 start_codon:yes stop_codon:yes gene_type:complete
MNNITKYILFLPLVLFLVSCGGDSSSDDSFTYYQKKPVEPSKLDLTIEASGEVEAIYSVEIKSKASGEILDLPAEVGDFVEKGSILARIDQRTPKNILDQAEADLRLAEVRLTNASAQLERGTALHNEGSIADKNFEEIQESFASAKSQHVRSMVNVENAKISLDDTLVKSPLSATIISRPVEVGQVISSPTTAVGGGTLLMQMADLSKVRIRAFIDEIDIGKVSVGQNVSIRVSAFREEVFSGTVSKIEPLARVEQGVTIFPVLIDIDNKDNLLLLGMNTDVVIQVVDKDVALSAPTGALRTRKDVYSGAEILGISKEKVDKFLEKKVIGENFTKFIVFKSGSIEPEMAWVEIGISDLSRVEIKEGLNKGDSVFVLPSKGLVDRQERFRQRVKSWG